eukprot:XP_001697779.1 predicted protein [Chlamydomonas reinhardtii]
MPRKASHASDRESEEAQPAWQAAAQRRSQQQLAARERVFPVRCPQPGCRGPGVGVAEGMALLTEPADRDKLQMWHSYTQEDPPVENLPLSALGRLQPPTGGRVPPALLINGYRFLVVAAADALERGDGPGHVAVARMRQHGRWVIERALRRAALMAPPPPPLRRLAPPSDEFDDALNAFQEAVAAPAAGGVQGMFDQFDRMMEEAPA